MNMRLLVSIIYLLQSYSNCRLSSNSELNIMGFILPVVFGFILASCDSVHKQPEILPPEVGASSSRLKSYLRDAIFSDNDTDDISMIKPIVQTKSGFVEGYHSQATDGRKFFAFEGIPYGEPTGGNGRWKSPVPRRQWDGTLSATRPGPACLQLVQLRMFAVTGSEDCLFLNVYTPKIKSSVLKADSGMASNGNRAPLPVVVFIHGGMFSFGSGSTYGPAYLLNENVVLVTINYRVGVLGFLSIPKAGIPGNFGLKDQGLALHWVQENIESFGGNPNNVTLMGNSAGGVSAHLHLISDRTRHLFSSAYSSSGTAFQHWAVQSTEKLVEYAYRLGAMFECHRRSRRFGFEEHEDATLGTCLKGLDSNALVAAQYNLHDWAPFPIVTFSPTVEPEDPHAFLTVWPEEAYRLEMVAKKPFIIGYNEDEGRSLLLLFLIQMKGVPLRLMWEQIAPIFLDYKDQTENPDEITKKIEEFYLQRISPRRADISHFLKMFSDRYINFGVIKGLQAHTSCPCADSTYLYRFSFTDSKHGMGNAVGLNSKEYGAAHGEDLFYFFNASRLVDGQTLADPEHDLSKIMIKLLVQFVATGVPSFPGTDGILYTFWDPVLPGNPVKALQFDKRVEMIGLPDSEMTRLKFWNDLKLQNFTLWSQL